MGDFQAFCQFVWQRLTSVTDVLVSYCLLRTDALSRLTEGGTFKEKVEKTASLMALVVVAIVGTNWLLLGSVMPDPLTLIRTSAISLISSVALAAPLYLVLRFVARVNAAFLIFSMACIQQFFFIILIAASTVILYSAEPARTDFTLMRSDMGTHTLAYRAICEPISNAAELVVQAKIAGAHNRAIATDIETVLSWQEERFSPTGDAMNQRFMEIEAQFDRRNAELAETHDHLRRQSEMLDRENLAKAEFFAHYPTIIPAAFILALGVIVVVLLTSAHVWKAGVHPVRAWSRKLAVGGCLILAWSASVGLIVLIILTSTPRVDELRPEIPSISARPSTEEARAFVTEAMRLSDSFDDDIETQTSLLRRTADNMRFVCPNVEGRGLW